MRGVRTCRTCRTAHCCLPAPFTAPFTALSQHSHSTLTAHSQHTHSTRKARVGCATLRVWVVVRVGVRVGVRGRVRVNQGLYVGPMHTGASAASRLCLTVTLPLSLPLSLTLSLAPVRPPRPGCVRRRGSGRRSGTACGQSPDARWRGPALRVRVAVGVRVGVGVGVRCLLARACTRRLNSSYALCPRRGSHA